MNSPLLAIYESIFPTEVLFFLIYLALFFLINFFTYRQQLTEYRFYLNIFYLFYCINCFLGAVLIGLSHGSLLSLLQPQGGYKLLPEISLNWNLYWFLVFAPLYFLPLVFYLLRPFSTRKMDSSRKTYISHHFFIIFSLFLLVLNIPNFQLLTWRKWLSNGLGYNEVISARTWTLSKIDFFSLNYFYVLLPIGFIPSLLNFFRKKTFSTLLFPCCYVGILFLFSTLTFQKMLLFIPLFVGASVLFLRGIISAKMNLLLLLLQSFLMWAMLVQGTSRISIAETLFHFVFRTSSVFPYYIEYLSNGIGFPGYDMPMDGKNVEDNILVFRSMFPKARWAGGSNSAPFHLRSYFQGGILFVFIETLLLGALIYFIHSAKNIFLRSQQIFSSAIVVLLFYATQTSLKECLISSYGILIALFFMVLVNEALSPKERVDS